MTRARRTRWILGLTAGPVFLGAAVLLLPLRPAMQLTRVPLSSDDSVRVVAGARYRGGAIRRFLFGRDYRAVWTEPALVEVLRLDRVDGGLRPVREGGGMETRSLHFQSANGRHYVFRSIDKEMTRLLPHGLDRSLLAEIFQDQTSSAHPAGVLVAARLQAAVGLPSGHPRLVVLPDAAALAGFRPRFAGLLGTFQDAPGEARDGADSGGTVSAKHTEQMLALLDAGPANRVDVRAFLRARLLDFFLNDWDRHEGQWRWLPRAEEWGTVWHPVPVDRDQAFASYDGAVLAIARLRAGKLSAFGPDFPHLRGLTHNSGDLDRRLLAGLDRSGWDSIVVFLQDRLTDSVIADAVHTMPPAWWGLSGPRLAATLRLRRAGIARIGMEFYASLARQPEIHVPAAGVLARLDHLSDGSLELRLEPAGGRPALGPWFARRFRPGATDVLTLVLHGERSSLLVSGSGPDAIAVRVVDTAGKPMREPAAGR